MKILISGGTGLIGKELGKALVEKNHEVLILTRNPQKAKIQCPFPHTALSWNELENHPELANLDHIINLAGTNVNERRWNKDFKNKIHSSRVETTKKLVIIAETRCPKLKSFVSTSAIGIYGNTERKIVTEDHPKGSSFLAHVCKNWEEAAKNLQIGRVVIFRVGIVFSDKGGALEKMVPPIQMGLGGAISGGHQFMSWIDIEDLVNMYIFALEKPIEGTFNAIAPNPITNKDLTQTIGKHLDKKTFLMVPYPALRILLGELANYLVESQKINPQKIQKEGFKFLYPKAEDSIKKRVPTLKRMGRKLIFEQWIPKTKEETFSFFSKAENLEKITPKELYFKILNISTKSIKEGTRINYKLRINGVPIKWQTLITQWNPSEGFVDRQEKGPFKNWNHFHLFKKLGNGTLIIDELDIEIPFGFLGYIATSWKVFRDVEKIFNYRRQVLHKKILNILEK